MTANEETAGKSPRRMPVVFVGHGSPMTALEDDAFTREWEALVKRLPRPRAILCVSAHWETLGVRVGAMEHPRTIHDFGGFPDALFRKQYPAPGAPALAEETRALLSAKAPVVADLEWGLDHGAWAPLSRFYPEADIPVFQLSLDRTQPARFHFELGRLLMPLRERGVLIVGSGNIVHNLGLMEERDMPLDWAAEFDAQVTDWIERRDYDALIDYERAGRAARLSAPTNEHYLPLLYALALRGEEEPLAFFAEGYAYGSLSMRSVVIGAL